MGTGSPGGAAIATDAMPNASAPAHARSQADIERLSEDERALRRALEHHAPRPRRHAGRGTSAQRDLFDLGGDLDDTGLDGAVEEADRAHLGDPPGHHRDRLA